MTNEDYSKIEINGVIHELNQEQIDRLNVSLKEKEIYDMTEEELTEFINEQTKELNEIDDTPSIKVLFNQQTKYDKEMEAFDEVQYRIDESIEFLNEQLEDDMKIVLIMELLKSTTQIGSVDYHALDRLLEDKYWDFDNKKCVDNYYYDYTNNTRRSFADPRFDTNYPKSTSYKATYAKTKEEFTELTLKDYDTNCKITFSPIATAKIFTMMLLNPNIEFGGYLSYSSILPKIEDIYNTEPIEIIVDDFLLIPQTRSSSRIDYFEFDLPEFMQDWRDAKENKQFTSARHHSHHTLSAFHSRTDREEIIEMAKQKSKFFSVVTAFKDKPFDKDVDLLNFDHFFDNIEVDSVLYLPFLDETEAKANNAEYGYLVETNIVFSEYGQKEIEETLEFVERFKEMELFVKYKFPTIQKLNILVQKKVLTEEDVYAIRETLNGSEELYNIFNALFDVLNNVVSKDKLEAQTKIIEEIKKLVK